MFEQKFIAIVKAYEVLSDEVMRRKYDASSQQSAETYDVNVDDFGAAWAAYQSHGVEDTPTNWFLMGLVFIGPFLWACAKIFQSHRAKKSKMASQKAAIVEAAVQKRTLMLRPSKVFKGKRADAAQKIKNPE